MVQITKLAEAESLKLHQLTTWEGPGVPVDTVDGPVSNIEWSRKLCERVQADRTMGSMRRALIVQRPGKEREIAVFCDKAPDVMEVPLP